MTTQGDQILTAPCPRWAAKACFVKELEVALEEGRADLAVHSLKDVPMELPSGFNLLACVLEREDPRDALGRRATPVWPSCPRAQWWAPPACAARPCCRRCAHLRIEPLRGNLDTRLRKPDEGQYAAIVLAAAPVSSACGLHERTRTVLSPEDMLPAAGQGALGLKARRARRGDCRPSRPSGRCPHLAVCGGRARRQPRHGGSCSDAAGQHGQC